MTDTDLPWRLFGRLIRPYALAVSPWSNHADGNAADCGTINGATGNYTSLASDGKARRIFEKLGGCFPVTNPWEPWHAEMRNR